MIAKRRKILSGSFAASLMLHLLALLFFQRYSLWFSSPQKLEPNGAWLSLVDKKERDEILKVAFEPGHSEEASSKAPNKPEAEPLSSSSLRTSPHLPEYELLKSVLFQAPPLPNELLATHPFLPTFSIPSQAFNLLDYLPKDLIVPAQTQQKSRFLPLPTHSAVTVPTKPPAIEQETPPVVYSEPASPPFTDLADIAKAPNPIPLPSFPILPTLAELETSSFSDSFDADLVFLPKEDGSGYIFALTLIPRPDLELPKIRQHFTFLIDRSNSIQQGRLSATKGAIHKALAELSSDDTFNIIAFDSKMEKMSPNSLPCVGKSLAIAEEFLEKIQLGSFFSSSDLYKPLFLTVPGQVSPGELYTAILLTDGETLAKKNGSRSILRDWTQYNSGKVTLYALGVNSDPHMAILDAAAVLNKGKLSNAPTHRGLKRKLLKLLKTIQNPIAKNLSCKAISRSPQAKIQLFPKPSQMPHLYVDQPYVILGETDTLDDFILFVQGHLKDRWLNIKKTISFVNAKKGSKSLKQEWALQRAYTLYEQFAFDENPKHLAEAKNILEPFDFPVPFQ